ncbi:MAG: hypothetical protein HRU35_03275 [Rickettsiaceae bacterium]|nr:hypothetical protein [Rickettsiaceae bacterium]
MSNHDGSEMLNSVLFLLKDKYNFFNEISEEDRVKFISEIIKIGNCYDCSHGEIMENLGKDLKFCYTCRKATQDFEQGYDICGKCKNKYLG